MIMPFECRALPSVNSVKTWDATADDGHELVLEVEGIGSQTDPIQISLQVMPLTFDDGAPDAERWPTLAELLEGCDAAAPGLVFHLLFTSMPNGLERTDPAAGEIRQMQVQQVGAMQAPSRLVSV